MGNDPLSYVDPNGMDRIFYGQNGNEVDREVEEDWQITIGGKTFNAKVMGTYFVSVEGGDVEFNGTDYIQGVSRESLFGDVDDSEHSSSFFTELDQETISTVDKANELVSNQKKGGNFLDYFLNARSRRDNDFKRSILAGDKTSDTNVNTSYVLTGRGG